MLGKSLITAAAGNAGGVATDDNFSDTTLLLQGDTSNEAMLYNAFGDASTNAHNITPVGGVYGTPFSPYNESWSVEFDGTGDKLTVASDASLQLGSESNWTIEMWMQLVSTPSNFDVILGKGNSGTFEYFIEGFSDRTIDFLYSSNGSPWTGQHQITPVMDLGEWFHLAVVRDGASLKSYVNGVEYFSGSAGNIYIGSGLLSVGGYAYAAQDPNVILSNVRIVKGTSVYTSNFTPSTTPLTDVSGTSLLTCNANRFIDTSSNAHTITVNGNPEIRGFSPFADTDTVTGSGYFDGDDYLRFPSTTLSGDFTIETWFYQNTNDGAYVVLIAGSTGTYNFPLIIDYTNAGTVGFYLPDTTAISNKGSYNLREWNHLALTRSGTTLRLYLNGVEVGTATSSTTLTLDDIGGRSRDNANNRLDGYMTDTRIVDGTALYTANFTPPTSPLTAVSGTSLLTLQNRGANRNIGFIDSSHPTRVITRNGNVTQGSFSPFSQDEGKWGNYFGAAGNYLTTPNSSTFSFDADFTVECWVYQTERGNNGVVAEIENYQNGVMIRLGTEGGIYDAIYVNNTLIVRPVQYIDLNTWAHIAVVRSGTTVTVYIDGVSRATATVSGTVNSTSGETRLGAPLHTTATAQPFFGYITNFRIVKGTAVYTSAFTPSTTPLTAISGTSLLTCQSNRFVDNSSNAHSITVNGDPEVTPFSPFAPSTAYDPATKGGSGYFDNIGDYLSAAHDSSYNFGSGAFTVEAWVWFDDISTHNEAFIIGLYGSQANRRSWLLSRLNSDIRFRYSADGSAATAINLGTTLKLNTWYHIAVTRDSSSDVRIFLNGVPNTATNVTTTFYNNTVDPILIGDTGAGSVYAFNGYIADARVVTGNAVYTSAFTPPTSPLTAVSGTSFLCNFTNAGIYDGTGRNVLETVGDAHVENSVKKYGTGSMQFDGTGDYLLLPEVAQLSFADSEDFTVEMWVYSTAQDASGGNILVSGVGGDNVQFYIKPDTGAIGLYLNDGFGLTETSPAVVKNQWQHLAWTRQGSTCRAFVDGQLIVSGTRSTAFKIGMIGAYSGGGFEHNGYIDDLRITKGVARYTANFTPPAAKLPNL